MHAFGATNFTTPTPPTLVQRVVKAVTDFNAQFNSPHAGALSQVGALHLGLSHATEVGKGRLLQSSPRPHCAGLASGGVRGWRDRAWNTGTPACKGAGAVGHGERTHTALGGLPALPAPFFARAC
jgi:hypothetical protein